MSRNTNKNKPRLPILLFRQMQVQPKALIFFGLNCVMELMAGRWWSLTSFFRIFCMSFAHLRNR